MNRSRLGLLTELFWVSLKLGLTSFGGPAAHLGYFRDVYVRRRRWLDERDYAELVALCQLLPGPASSQVGIGIGTMRAGLWGGAVAWLGFTLPSAVALTLFALVLQSGSLSTSGAGWIHGLKLVAVAVVAHAVLGMGLKLAAGRLRATVAVAAAAVSVLWATPYTQVLLLVVAALGGLWYSRLMPAGGSDAHVGSGGNPVADTGLKAGPFGSYSYSRTTALAALGLFFVLLLGLPLLRSAFPSEGIALFDSFYRAGSLVFGGGHVVLPLLEDEVVRGGWMNHEQFLAGYGAVQAVPGPLFTFSAYLGAIAGGVSGALIATVAIFLPAYLLVIGTLPFWKRLQSTRSMQGALTLVNAAVVGLLLAALYDPIWTSSVQAPKDFAIASLLFVAIAYWQVPSWILVLAGAAVGAIWL
ncbi:chromate efflux transporter [Paenibacillus sp. HJGM_3]|uniref:chromate efflux transporter n=1 Tax=Paenibacillus sp. HJGM_3 TaxID=3379816 RepID=UPI00385A6F71